MAIALTAEPAVGQTVPSPYEFVEPSQDLGAFVAYLSTNRGTVDLGPKSAALFGLQYAIRLNDPMQLGAFVAYMPGERDVIDPRAEGGPRVIGTQDLTLLLLAGRLQLNLTGVRTWNNLMPYLLVGIGIAIDASADPSCALNPDVAHCRLEPRDRFDFGNSFLGQLGLGAAWLPTERFGLRLTVHDNIWRLKAPSGFLDPELALDPVPSDTEWLNNFQFSAGLSLWF